MAHRQRWHHYIPEMHLANFVGYSRRRFAVFDRLHGKTAVVPVKTSARLSNYYLLPGKTPGERLRFENQFQIVESRVAPIIKQLISIPEGPVYLPAPTKVLLAQYIALLHARVPARREPSYARAREWQRT